MGMLGEQGQVQLGAPHIPHEQGNVSSPNLFSETSSHFPETRCLRGQEKWRISAKKAGSEQAAGGARV